MFFLSGSDLHNGIVGFTLNSQTGQVLDEDSDNRTAVLFLQRQENRLNIFHFAIA